MKLVKFAGAEMKNHVFINYEKDGLGYPEKCQLLISGTIKSIFPFALIGDKKNKKAIFDTSGFIRLKDFKSFSDNEILNIAELITTAFDEIREYPIFVEKMVITPDTVFFSRELTKLRLLYIPSYRTESEKEIFCYLIHYLAEKEKNPNKDITETIINYTMENDFDTRKIRELISDIKVEIE